MFLQDDNKTTTDSGLFGAQRSGSGVSDYTKDILKAFREALSPDKYVSSFIALENSAKQTARNIFGTVGSVSKDIQETIRLSFNETIQIGASLEDNINMYESISKKLLRNNYLTRENLSNLIAIQKTTGLAAEEVATLVVGFQDLGQGTEMAVESIGRLSNEARKYGLNVGTFLKTVGENIKLVNAFGFKDGVEGLGRMVARAQALRMDFTQVKSLAADLLNPEKAITLAAEMQTLGGAIGDLGDPFKLMYMAENDMEGLQNAIIDTAKSAVMFNEETGQFKLTGVEMRRLRAQSEALGLSYEDMANTATKAAKEQYVLSQMDFSGLNDQQKQLVANLAEVGKGGEIKLKLPGFEGSIKDFTSQSEKDQQKLFDAMKKQQDDLTKSDKEIALSQLSIADQQLIELRAVRTAILRSGDFLSTDVGSTGADIKTVLESLTSSLGNAATAGLTELGKKINTKTLGELIAGNTKSVFGDTVENLTTTMISEFAKEFKPTMEKFNISVDNLKNVVEGLNTEMFKTGKSPFPKSDDSPFAQYDDVILPPLKSNSYKISGPEGSIKLNNMDTIMAGTDLFGGNKQDNTPKNIELRINGGIRVDGLRGDTLGELLMNDPAFVAKIKDVITSTPNQSNQKYG